MTSHSIFDADSLLRLRERIGYEVWLLEEIYALTEQKLFPAWPDGVIYTLGSSKPQFINYGRINIICGDWRPHFQNAGAPLVFVSTFKLLDMLMEWILEMNEVQPEWRFKQKLKQLCDSPLFPPVLENRIWLKARLTALYRNLEPLRGTIIHDKQFFVTDGAISVVSSKGNFAGMPIEISADHLRKLSSTIVSVLRYVDGSWTLDESHEKIVRFNLDELKGLHKCPPLGQMFPYHTCVRVYSESTDPFDIDLVPIKREVSNNYPNQDVSFDLRILLVKGGEVFDSYFFPWFILTDTNNNLSEKISDYHLYRDAIPDDVKAEHLNCVMHDQIKTGPK